MNKLHYPQRLPDTSAQIPVSFCVANQSAHGQSFQVSATGDRVTVGEAGGRAAREAVAVEGEGAEAGEGVAPGDTVGVMEEGTRMMTSRQ